MQLPLKKGVSLWKNKSKFFVLSLDKTYQPVVLEEKSLMCFCNFVIIILNYRIECGSAMKRIWILLSMDILGQVWLKSALLVLGVSWNIRVDKQTTGNQEKLTWTNSYGLKKCMPSHAISHAILSKMFFQKCFYQHISEYMYIFLTIQKLVGHANISGLTTEIKTKSWMESNHFVIPWQLYKFN